MNDYPSTAKFLNEDEKREISRRLEDDRSSLADEFGTQYFWQAIKDWKIWVHMFITIGIYTPLYSFSLFLPTIIKTLGYTNNTAQLMSVPPYIVACFCCITGGYLADRFQTRGLPMMGFTLIAILGLVLQIASYDHHVKYFGTFLFASGIYPNVPQGLAWNGNNMGGTVKRGVGIAMHVGFGNFGGIVASFVYLPKYAPRFVEGHSILIALLSMSFTLQACMTLYYRRENARRNKEYKQPEQYTTAEKTLERERGDYASFFRYTV